MSILTHGTDAIALHPNRFLVGAASCPAAIGATLPAVLWSTGPHSARTIALVLWFSTSLLLLGIGAIAVLRAENPLPHRRRVRLEADRRGLCVDGKRWLSRGNIRHAKVMNGRGRATLRIELRGKMTKPFAAELPNEATGRELVEALGFAADRNSADRAVRSFLESFGVLDLGLGPPRRFLA